MTGYQVQGKSQYSRGLDPAADLVGKHMAENFSLRGRDSMALVTDSRYGVRVASLRMDANNLLVFPPQIEVAPSDLGPEHRYLLLRGSIDVPQHFRIVHTEKPFRVYEASTAEAK